MGLEPKYLKKREASIPLRGLSQNLFSAAGEAFRPVRAVGGKGTGPREAKPPSLPHCRPSERAGSAAASLQTRLGASLLRLLPRAAAAQLTGPLPREPAPPGEALWPKGTDIPHQEHARAARPGSPLCAPPAAAAAAAVPAKRGSEEPMDLGLGDGGPESVPGSGV